MATSKMLSKTSLLLASIAAASLVHSEPNPPRSIDNGWSLENFSNLIVFGDSYSDESRLTYWANHNFTLPPAGTVLPENLATASGGRIWNRYVVQYTGATLSNGTFAPQISLFNYAVGGGVCSNSITPRDYPGTSHAFPAILEDQLPIFLTDLHTDNPSTGKNVFYPGLTADNAVYVVWTGGNDLGEAALFTDSQVPGKTIVDYLECTYVAMDRLYESGARYFVLPNQPPFDLSPLYANDTSGGNISLATSKGYWPAGKWDNHTAVAAKMQEYIAVTNDGYYHRTPYATVVANRYPGAHIANFDMYSLFHNIYYNPNDYLNGTRTPYNTSAYAHGPCTVTSGVCSDPGCCDSFLWYDTLHKSEQTDRIIAREFVNVISGNSSYATYW